MTVGRWPLISRSPQEPEARRPLWIANEWIGLFSLALVGVFVLVTSLPVSAQTPDSTASTALRGYDAAPPPPQVGLETSAFGWLSESTARTPPAGADSLFSETGVPIEDRNLLLYSASFVVRLVTSSICQNRTSQSWRCDPDVADRPFYPFSPDAYDPISSVNESWFNDPSRYPRKH